MASILFSMIAGVGRAAALRFAKSYPVVLLARSPESYQDTVIAINHSGGKAIGISTDANDPKAVKSAFELAKKEFPGAKLAAAVYNVAEGFVGKPFLELTVDDLDGSLGLAASLPLLLDAIPESRHLPTLIVTGASASLKGSAFFSTMSAAKFAQRAITQSLAREFGPKGVPVTLAVIDGVVDIQTTASYTVNDGVDDGKINADAIAENYWNLHKQHRSAFTQELDVRPYVEKF